LFKTTAWHLVDGAKHRDKPEYLDAMNRFIAGYWKPIFHYVRSRGYGFQQAEDLTQEFFGRFLEKDWLVKADPERGRFRNFLLRVLQRFLADQSSDRTTRQAAFDRDLLCVSSLTAGDDQRFDPPAGCSPDDVFMRQWARSAIDNARRRLEVWCREKGRPDWYRIFAAANFADVDGARLTQNELAERFRLSRDQIRHALERTEDQFGLELRAELGDQLADESQVDEEIGDLLALLSAS
jgi:RNA polymerase sigma-70 factor (ECF subfamily)